MGSGGGRGGGGGVEPYLGVCYLREVRATTAWRWSSEWRCGTCGRALQPGGSFVRSFVRSGLCSEVASVLASLAVLSGRTRRPAVLEHGSSAVCLCRLRRRWTMPHGAVVAWRRAPALEPRDLGVSCLVGSDLGQNGPCGILLKTKPSQKKQAGPADAISYRVRCGQNTATQRTFPITAIAFLCPLGPPYTYGHGP